MRLYIAEPARHVCASTAHFAGFILISVSTQHLRRGGKEKRKGKRKTKGKKEKGERGKRGKKEGVEESRGKGKEGEDSVISSKSKNMLLSS